MKLHKLLDHIMEISAVLKNLNSAILDFYTLVSKDQGAYCSTVVCLSVRLSFVLLLNQYTYKAHIWYEGISHQYASAGTKVKVIWKGQAQI